MKARRIKLVQVNEERIGWHGQHLDTFMNRTLMLRTARKVGDVEMVGNYCLGKLKEYKSLGLIDFEIV